MMAGRIQVARACQIATVAAALFGAPAHAVTIDWVTVGDPGNACDPGLGVCPGAVANVYRISKFETTNAQYAEFLNAVAATDANALYNMNMDSPAVLLGGITRSGSSGSFTYNAIAGREDKPVNWVSFYDALRFTNWLHNGQPTGVQDNTTTEDGAYTITPLGIADNSITRNPGATIFLPGDDEWYKAAYYDAVSMSYFGYPAATHTQTVCATPGATPNTANCGMPTPAVGDLTDVGSYAGSASPNGTFDQGGNVAEWNEDIFVSFRGQRGGSWGGSAVRLAASSGAASAPTRESGGLGFRVASIPEPGESLLVMTGILGLASVCVRKRRY